MTPEELIKYELPNIAEFVSINWLQNIIAWYYGKKVSRKWERYKLRKIRERYFTE